MANKRQSFNVTARVNILVAVDIKAGSWEDALVQAQSLKESDFVDIKGEFIDHEPIQIQTIWTPDI